MSGRHPVRDGTLILRVGLGGALFFAVLVLAAWALGLDVDASPGGAEETTAVAGDGRVDVLGDLGGGAVTESSGLAVSRTHPEVFWTHNDEPGEATLYAFGFDGTERASVTVEGVVGEDWEDVSLAPCPGASAGDCLWFADIGDNDAIRESVSVHAVPEPDLAEGGGTVQPVATLTFRYPDGPADAEALAVGPDGRLFVATKGEDGTARLYELPSVAAGAQATAAAAGDPAVAEQIGTLPLDVGSAEDRVTAGAISPDGSTLALRSHVAVFLFALDRPLASPVVCQLGQIQPQGEGLDFIDDTTLLLTSEAPRGPAPIVRVRCP